MPAQAEVIDISAQMAEVAAMREQAKRDMEEVAALKVKLERRAEIREEVSEAVMEERRRAFGKQTEPEKFVMPVANGEKLVKMTLERHYVPRGYYEVVGYNKEAVVKKRADGQMVTVEPAAFIPDEKKPHAMGGVGFIRKIWAGTVLRLQETEAKEARKAGIASVDID